MEDRTRIAGLKEERDPILRGKITPTEFVTKIGDRATQPAYGRIETLRLS
jgi:hypothetical protein